MRINKTCLPFLYLFLFFLSTFSVPADDQRVIILASAEEVAGDKKHIILIGELREAFSRIGYELQHHYYPEARCKYLADSGAIDGLPSRVRDFGMTYINLLRVNVPVDIKEFIAYTIRSDLSLEGWESLADRELRVIYLNGFFIVEKWLSELIPPDFLRAVEKRKSAMTMLKIGRADLFIDIKQSAERVLSENEKDFSDIREAGIMERDEHFLYLHKKHRALLPELERVMLEMKNEGAF